MMKGNDIKNRPRFHDTELSPSHNLNFKNDQTFFLIGVHTNANFFPNKHAKHPGGDH